jgi:hypothetical protein
MNHELPPLDRDLAHLLAAERNAPELPFDVEQEMLARLEATLFTPPVPPLPPAAVPGAAMQRGGAAAAGSALSRLAQWLWKPAPVGILALGAGIVIGATSFPHPEDVTLARHTNTMRVIERHMPAPTYAPSEDMIALPDDPQPAQAPQVAPPRVRDGRDGTTSDATSVKSRLTEERSLIEIARAALARGDGDAALNASGDHAKRFPEGLLAEEREALAVQALAVQGNADQARARARTFRAKYPGSLFRSAVDGATPEK